MHRGEEGKSGCSEKGQASLRAKAPNCQEKNKAWLTATYIREKLAVDSRGQRKDQIKWKQTLTQLSRLQQEDNPGSGHGQNPRELDREVPPSMRSRHSIGPQTPKAEWAVQAPLLFMQLPRMD